MSESGLHSSSQRRTVNEVRRARRVDGGYPFWPYGFLPAAGLVSLIWLGSYMHILHAKTKAQVPTARPAVSTPVATTPTAVPVETPTWNFSLYDGVISLRGDVPDEESKETLVAAARGRIDPPRVVSIDNQLRVTGAPAPSGHLSLALRGINTVSRCDRGTSSFADDTFSLTCELPQSGADAVRAQATEPLPYGQLGTINMLSNEAVASCEQSLSDLLSVSRIEFASGSAEITPSSSRLLDRVADSAAACPGTLRIEGHTDNLGSAALNDNLSQRRAEAVRAALIYRGLSGNRLIAAGYGSTQPIAENSTSQGRSRNRRIEIRVVRASDSNSPG